jgi:hypothetical protein
MVMQPDVVKQSHYKAARDQAAGKRDLPAMSGMRFERFAEGRSAQIMYLGAYADEGPTITRMHEFIGASGYMPHGKHHEIYLGDPRRSAPEKLKTALRQPVKRQSKR